MMSALDMSVVGKLIACDQRRAQWVALVEQLRIASAIGGPLEGWVFHGTYKMAGEVIKADGLSETSAIVPLPGGDWTETTGVHFGTPSVAAFFAEDRIESFDDPDLELMIFGAPLERLTQWGELAADGAMIDVPLYSRLHRSMDCVDAWIHASLAQDTPVSWRQCLDYLETVVVLGAIPAFELTCFESAEDVFIEVARIQNDRYCPRNC